MFKWFTLGRLLRSLERNLLVISTARTKQSKAAFSCYAGQFWNHPADYKGAPPIVSIKSSFKTQLFSDAFC